MKTYQDLLTRAGWTLAQSGLAILVTSLADVPAWWALPLATALSAVKTWLVTRSTKTPVLAPVPVPVVPPAGGTPQ